MRRIPSPLQIATANASIERPTPISKISTVDKSSPRCVFSQDNSMIVPHHRYLVNRPFHSFVPHLHNLSHQLHREMFQNQAELYYLTPHVLHLECFLFHSPPFPYFRFVLVWVHFCLLPLGFPVLAYCPVLCHR